MGRPKKQNPKSEHLGVSCTKEKKYRVKRLGLKNDELLDVVLYYLETDKMELEVDKIFTIKRIKEIDKTIQRLQYEKIGLEAQVEELNQKIGISGNGMNADIQKSIDIVLQRFNNQSVYNILEFLDNNKTLLENQAFLCGLSPEKLGDLVFDQS